MALNIYKFIHKTIRGQLSQLYIQAGRTTYHDFKQVSALHHSTLSLSKFLENHATREDTFVHPVLKEISFPDLPAMEEEHRTTDVQLKTVVSQITEINNKVASNNTNTENLEEVGYEFYLTLGDFISSYLKHMSNEERKIMPFLWAKLAPDKILGILMGMQSTVTNQEIIETIPVMYPYLNHQEAVKLTGMLKNEPNFSTDMIPEIRKSLQPELCAEVFKQAGVDISIPAGEQARLFSTSSVDAQSTKKSKRDLVGVSLEFNERPK